MGNATIVVLVLLTLLVGGRMFAIAHPAWETLQGQYGRRGARLIVMLVALVWAVIMVWLWSELHHE